MSNFFELFQKYNQFKQMLEQSQKNPKELLDAELKKRNMSSKEIQDLLSTAQSLSKLFGVK